MSKDKKLGSVSPVLPRSPIEGLHVHWPQTRIVVGSLASVDTVIPVGGMCEASCVADEDLSDIVNAVCRLEWASTGLLCTYFRWHMEHLEVCLVNLGSEPIRLEQGCRLLDCHVVGA